LKIFSETKYKIYLSQNNSEICLDQQVKDVLRAMLNPNPKFRMRPH
jgi:hypothetical protein